MPFSDDSIYSPPRRGAGWRVLVMRRWPRGVRKDRIDEWLPDAAPSLDLLHAYQKGKLDFTALARRYTAELRTRPTVLQHLRALESEHHKVVLLCWERPPRPCHRTVLVRLLNRRRSDTAAGRKSAGSRTGGGVRRRLAPARSAAHKRRSDDEPT